jgi:uncharacterized membrane protein YfcA
MDISIGALAIIGTAFLLAGLVKGVIGMGLPIVAIGLLALIMTPAQAAVLLIVPSLVTNVWQMLAGPALLSLLRRLWPLLLALVVGTFAGGAFLVADASGRATAALGIVLVVHAVLGLSKVRFHVRPRAEPWLAPIIGFVTGIISAATSVFVVPVLPYYQAIGLEKDELVQTLGLSFTVSTLALAAVLARYGMFQTSIAGPSLLALVAALLGMVAGQWVRRRVSAETFRRWFFIGLVGLGVHLALRYVI